MDLLKRFGTLAVLVILNILILFIGTPICTTAGVFIMECMPNRFDYLAYGPGDISNVEWSINNTTGVYTDEQIEAAFRAAEVYFAENFEGAVLERLKYDSESYSGKFSENSYLEEGTLYIGFKIKWHHHIYRSFKLGSQGIYHWGGGCVYKDGEWVCQGFGGG